MASKSVESEIGCRDIDAAKTSRPQQRGKKSKKLKYTGTETVSKKKKKSGSGRKYWLASASTSSSIQGGGFLNVPVDRIENKFQNRGATGTQQRRSIDTRSIAAYKFTRLQEEEYTTEEEEASLSYLTSEEEEEEKAYQVEHIIKKKNKKTTTYPCSINTGINPISSSTRRPNSRSRNPSLSDKYRPKLFEDIIGHDINVKALCGAVCKDKVAPLYIFHGPSGTGKTSTATIFAMASNCESPPSTVSWPCWSCRGCSMTLYINDLSCTCSSSRRSSNSMINYRGHTHTGAGGDGDIFERIKSRLLLLENQSDNTAGMGLAQTLKVKVFIITKVEEERCYRGTWDQMLSILDCNDSVIFVLIVNDEDVVPKAISSRCQKLSFPKLKDPEVILKLAQIAAEEGIQIERGALRLIAAKADGSMRVAENILEQVALLGSRVTSSMVQKLVGLVPRSKLISLLDMAMSSDAITTARQTRELIASGVLPHALISQLAALITDILSRTSPPSFKDVKDKRLSRRRKNRSLLSVETSQRLFHALKTLTKTLKQLQLQSSSDHATTRVVAALLELASDSISNYASTNIVLPKDIIFTDEKPDICHGKKSTAVILEEQCDLAHHCKTETRTHHFMNGLQAQPAISIANGAGASAKRTDFSANNRTAKMVEKPHWEPASEMDQIWQDILRRIHSPYLKEFLFQQRKLISLTVSRANMVVHLSLKLKEDKLAAEFSEEAISKALEEVFACPVAVNTSLQPTQLEEMERLTASKNEVIDPSSSGHKTMSFLPLFKQPHSPGGTGIVLKHRVSQTFVSKSEHTSRKMRHPEYTTQTLQGCEQNMGQMHSTPTFSGILTQGDRDDVSVFRGRASIMNMTHRKTCNIDSIQVKHRWKSLSSIQQAYASVEPYSQDLLFENVQTNGKQGTTRDAKNLRRVLSGAKVSHHHGKVLNRSWSCTDTICQDKTMKIKGNVGRLVETMNNSLLTLLKWKPRKDHSSVPGNEDVPNSG